MNEELKELRCLAARLLAQIDRLMAGTLSHQDDSPSEQEKKLWRKSPGGHLTAAGIQEIYRRFAAGESNAMIATIMDIGLGGVAKRRMAFRRQQQGSSQKTDRKVR